MNATRILQLLKQLEINARLPKGIEVMNPYQDPTVFALCEKFYRKYYADEKPRTLLLGINPGRFGSGATGISFTDPIRLESECGISNNLAKKPELSSDFIYRMIHAFGGTKEFYNQFFISAVSPLGFTKAGTNINYYDDARLEKAVTPFIIDSITKMIALGCRTDRCFCIGEGKNHKFLTRLNDSHHWFDSIIPLPHPRFIMQYRRKKLKTYIDLYLDALRG